MIDKELYDALPDNFAPRAAQLWEAYGKRIEAYSWRGQPFMERPVGGPQLHKVCPAIRFTVKWRAKGKGAVWADLERLEEILRGSANADITIDGHPAPTEDPAEGNTRLTEFYGKRPEEVEAEATLVCPLAKRQDWLHTEEMMDYGPQWRLVRRWNWRGVRCMLVNRWVPMPVDWHNEDVIDYWTGYVYFGDPALYRTEPDEEVTAYDLPDKIRDPGTPLPRVTYPQKHGPPAPDESGWIGWDNNFDEETDVPEDGPEEADMTEEEAVACTEILAKGVKELWQYHNLTPADIYNPEEEANAPVS